MDTLNKGVIHFPGKQLKAYELFIFGVFHLIFSKHSWLQVTETKKSKTADKGNYDINCDPLKPFLDQKVVNLIFTLLPVAKIIGMSLGNWQSFHPEAVFLATAKFVRRFLSMMMTPKITWPTFLWQVHLGKFWNQKIIRPK